MSGKTNEWEDVWFVQYRRPGSVISLAQCRQRDDGIEDLACKLQSAGWETRILHVEGDVLTERPSDAVVEEA